MYVSACEFSTRLGDVIQFDFPRPNCHERPLDERVRGEFVGYI